MNKFIVFCFASLLFLLSFSLLVPIVRCGDGVTWQDSWVIVFSGQDLNDGYGNTMDIEGWACGWVYVAAPPFLDVWVIRSYGVLAVTIDENTEVLRWRATAAEIIMWSTEYTGGLLLLKILAAQPKCAEVDLIEVEGEPYHGLVEVKFGYRTFAGSGMVQIENDPPFAFYNHLKFHRSQHFL